MSQSRRYTPGAEGRHLLHVAVCQPKSGRPNRLGRVGQRKSLPPRKPRRVKRRRLRCDCGRLAITVLAVRVGSDPQYTIHLPLCPACLALEQELHGEY